MSTILVVDSDPHQRASLAQVLSPLGEVEIAGTGLDALRLLATKKFSVVVLDLHVRPLDGFVILRTLSTKGGPNKETPIYALAADAAERDRALLEHALVALIKPVSLPTVKTLIDAGMNRPPPPSDESPAPPPVSSRTVTKGTSPPTPVTKRTSPPTPVTMGTSPPTPVTMGTSPPTPVPPSPRSSPDASVPPEKSTA